MVIIRGNYNYGNDNQQVQFSILFLITIHGKCNQQLMLLSELPGANV